MAETEKEPAHRFTVAQRVALVKKTRSLMRREGLNVREAAAKLGYGFSSYYRWVEEGKHKRRAPRRRAQANGNGAAVGSAEEGTLFNELLSLPQRLGKVEATLAALLKALGTSPQELAP